MTGREARTAERAQRPSGAQYGRSCAEVAESTAATAGPGRSAAGGRPGGAGAPPRRTSQAVDVSMPEDAERRLEHEARTSQLRHVQRGLIIQTAFPGDVILSTPLIRRAAERLGAPVDVLTIPPAAEVLANNPHIRDVIVFDKKGGERGLRALWQLAQRLRMRRYHTAYLAQASYRSAFLAWAARIPRRIGFRTAKPRWLYTHVVFPLGEVHQIERLLALADGAPERREPEIYPSAGDRAAVDALLAEAGISAPFIALAPGSAWGTKRWPFFPELARALAQDLPLAIVGGAGDRADARAIKVALGNLPVADGTGRLTLLQSGELIRRAAVLVANDSAPVHLASATRTPTVEIYGPTVPQFGFAARALHSRLVEPDPLACRPCHHHGPAVCPLVHHRCMRDTPVGAVLAEVRTVVHNVRLRGRG
jgi:heptosyltransferase-2